MFSVNWALERVNLGLWLGGRLLSCPPHHPVLSPPFLLPPLLLDFLFNFVLDEKVLHRFPDLNKDPQRFNAWLSAIGGELLTIDHQHINKNYKVCCDHFERRYYNRFNRLCINAVPTLNLKGMKVDSFTTKNSYFFYFVCF